MPQRLYYLKFQLVLLNIHLEIFMDALERNQTIKNYIQTLFVNEEESLKFARQNSLAEGMPDINVPPHVGKLISLLTKIRSPKRALEIGALGGYSTLWIARG